MRDMTYIERDEVGRGNVPVKSTQNSTDQRDCSTKPRFFLKHVPQAVRDLISRFWKMTTSRTKDHGHTVEKSQIKKEKDRDHTLVQRKRNVHNNDDGDVVIRHLVWMVVDEDPEPEEHISRDDFGSGNSCVLENAIIHYNDSASFYHSVMLHRRRLDSETLANVLSEYYLRPISSQPKKFAMKTSLQQ